MISYIYILPEGTQVYLWNAVEGDPVNSWDRLCREVTHIDSSAGKELPRIFMTELLSCAVDKLHIVIITQTARPFQFSFFEQTNVYLIRAEDLRLNEEDVKQYCRMCGIAVSKREIRQIYEYTEGWIVALYLTILQMQRGEGYTLSLGNIQLMENIEWKNLGDEKKRLLLPKQAFI